jgi:type II secretory pathway pseudopilin PulG
MSDTTPNNLSDTQPKKFKQRGRVSFWISLLVLLAVIVLGSLAGYGIGISARLDTEKAQLAQQLDEQFALARQDLDAGRYEIARQRLEHILKNDSSYPGVSEMLVEVQVKFSITPTLAPTATPTMTPTPDMRSQETILANARQQIQAKDWDGAIGSLDALRKADPTYYVVEVDGMYFIALRNRGIDQILGRGAVSTSNLEGGIYDLTLAERFGPLDNQAESLRTGARMFIQASSFYGVDWPQAASYFGEVYRFYPGLRDATGVTASQRYRESLLSYGDLKAQEKREKDRCQAIDLWNEAAAISPLDNAYAAKYNQLFNECYPPTPTIDPASLITPTLEVTVEPPTSEPPTEEPSPTP